MDHVPGRRKLHISVELQSVGQEGSSSQLGLLGRLFTSWAAAASSAATTGNSTESVASRSATFFPPSHTFLFLVHSPPIQRPLSCLPARSARAAWPLPSPLSLSIPSQSPNGPFAQPPNNMSVERVQVSISGQLRSRAHRHESRDSSLKEWNPGIIQVHPAEKNRWNPKPRLCLSFKQFLTRLGALTVRRQGHACASFSEKEQRKTTSEEGRVSNLVGCEMHGR